MPTALQSGSNIHYTLTGSGPAVILGHSFLCSGAMWDMQVPRLAEAHTVLNVDARGHGQSARVAQGLTLDDMLDDMLAVLDHAGVERAVWAGLSMGGMVAMRAALRAPNRVDGLILLDTDAGAEDAWHRIKYAALSRVARIFGLRPVLGQVESLMFGRTSRRERKELVSEWRERFAAVDLESLTNMIPAIAGREDLLPRLGDVDVPTLVIVGEEDEALPPERSVRLANAIRGAEYLEIERAGHLSALERPDAVTASMLAFLADLERPRSGPA